MNPEYTEYRFPQIKPLPWEKVFRHRTPREAIDFVSRLLGYDPSKRPRPLEALLDPYFDELRDQNTRLPNGQPMPNLFGFTEGKYEEIIYPLYNQQLCLIYFNFAFIRGNDRRARGLPATHSRMVPTTEQLALSACLQRWIEGLQFFSDHRDF